MRPAKRSSITHWRNGSPTDDRGVAVAVARARPPRGPPASSPARCGRPWSRGRRRWRAIQSARPAPRRPASARTTAARIAPFAGMLSQLTSVIGRPCDCHAQLERPQRSGPGRLRGASGSARSWTMSGWLRSSSPLGGLVAVALLGHGQRDDLDLGRGEHLERRRPALSWLSTTAAMQPMTRASTAVALAQQPRVEAVLPAERRRRARGGRMLMPTTPQRSKRASSRSSVNSAWWQRWKAPTPRCAMPTRERRAVVAGPPHRRRAGGRAAPGRARSGARGVTASRPRPIAPGRSARRSSGRRRR